MMLELKQVSAGYDGTPVLHDISFALPSGQNLCILGPNGCGKTTLVRTIGALIPFEGSITLDGKDVGQMKRREIASRIAVMSQIPSLYFSYSIYDTVMLGRYHHRKDSFWGRPEKEDREMVERCLATTGLTDLAKRELNTLSGGQLQRVFLAQTLAQNPQIILLDEPTNHLDMKHQIELINYLKQWSQEADHTVIGVLHDINLALRLTENVLFLKDGCMMGMGRADEIMSQELLQQVYDMDVWQYMRESYEKWEKIDPVERAEKTGEKGHNS